MKVRVITAIIGIIAVLGLVYLGGWFLTGAIFLVSLLALLEYDKMLKHFGVHIYLKATAIATAVMVLASGFYSLKAFLAAFFLALFHFRCRLFWCGLWQHRAPSRQS